MNAAGSLTVSEQQLEPGSSLVNAEALIEAARKHQRRRWRRRAIAGSGLALLLAAGVIGGVSLSGGTGRQAGRAGQLPSGPPAAMPPWIVVWTSTFRIEVLSSRTGRLIRTLATDVGLYQGLPTLAVSAAGVVYFDDALEGSEWVRSVPLAGGPVMTLGNGASPAISPNGRMLAYVTGPACSLPCPAKPETIVVRDLTAGTAKNWAFTSALPDITSLSWSPDSRYLAFAGTTVTKNGTVMVRSAQVLDTRAGGTLDRARQIPLGQTVVWAGYLSANTGVGVTSGPAGVIRAASGLVEVAVTDGRIIRRLTSLPPHGLGTDNALDGAEHTIAVDHAGRFILIAGTGGIYRWTASMWRPARITRDGLVAVWAG